MEEQEKPLTIAELSAIDAGEVRGMQVVLAYLLHKAEGHDASQIIEARRKMLEAPEEIETDQYAQIRNAMSRDTITRVCEAALNLIAD